MSDTPENPKYQLYRTLVGLKNTITAATAARENYHSNVGQTLRFVRDEYIKSLPDHQRAFVEVTVPPIDFTIPRPGNKAVWTVNSTEAWRLYSQLVPLLGPTKQPEASLESTDPAHIASRTAHRVFIVHGHDEAAREMTARFIEKLGYQPVILHEQANAGDTVIEKFETHANVPFAIVLLTPDDEGRKLGSPTLQKRARQNVVLELGYFLGRLGRKNVCALHRGDVEIPSDYIGVLFVTLDDGGGWRLRVAREMKAAGLDVDMNRAVEQA